MQGLITLDFGNTNPHAGLFQKIQDWQLINVVPLKELALYLDQLQMTPDNTSLVVCEVKAREKELETLQHQGFFLTRVKEYWRGAKFAGMPVNYANTLGEDRLIQAFYAYKKIKDNTLLLDAGTFLTMDVITPTGFQGGYIIPGIETYLSIFKKGEQLKSLELDENVSLALPKTTSEAMRDSYSSFAALAQKLIQDYKIQKVLITGGKSALWKKIFDDLALSVSVQSDPNLIHFSLHFWMTTQIETL